MITIYLYFLGSYNGGIDQYRLLPALSEAAIERPPPARSPATPEQRQPPNTPPSGWL